MGSNPTYPQFLVAEIDAVEETIFIPRSREGEAKYQAYSKTEPPDLLPPQSFNSTTQIMKLQYIHFTHIPYGVDKILAHEELAGHYDGIPSLVRLVAVSITGGKASITDSDDLFLAMSPNDGVMLIGDTHPLYARLSRARAENMVAALVEDILDMEATIPGEWLLEKIQPANTNRVNGTSFHNHEISRTYRDLEQVLGGPQEENMDKSNCMWCLEGRDEQGTFVFTIYDYKEYHDPRSTDITFDWHIGAHDASQSQRALKLLNQYL